MGRKAVMLALPLAQWRKKDCNSSGMKFGVMNGALLLFPVTKNKKN